MGVWRRLLLLALLTPACEPEEPPPPPPSLNLAIGTGLGDGTPGFVTLSDGQALTLEPGAQGGFHVYINVRLDADGLNTVGDFPLISREARRVSTGQLVSKSQHKVRLIPSEGAFETEKSIPLFLCPTPVGIPVADEVIELKVEVRANDGDEPITGTIRFVPGCAEQEPSDFCHRICFG